MKVAKRKMTNNVKYIENNRGKKLAYKYNEGEGVTFVWLSGYRSDFSGEKATRLFEFAKEKNCSALLFDYEGCGLSEGDADEGTISKWLDDAVFMIEKFTRGDLILIGSSMGGWISLLLSKRLNNIKHIGLIAPAPDFTKDLMWDIFTDEQRAEILENGFWIRPTPYDNSGYKVTKELIEDGNNNLILNDEIKFAGKVRILHGMLDDSVPFLRSVDLCKRINSDDIELTIIKNGDHRLSTPANLIMLEKMLKELM